MSKIVKVEIEGGGSYDIVIENDFDRLHGYIDHEREYFIITDENVASLYIDEFTQKVFGKKCPYFAMSAGEENKNHETVLGCYRALMGHGCDRSTTILALGGGVVGDVAGFAASTFMRGVPYIQIPTTLLSMVDSSVGGKTGYDLDGVKNIIGAFYQPRLVYINLSFLETLPFRELSTGMAECIKHSLISDAGYYSFIRSNKKGIRAMEKDLLEHLVSRSCEIKAAVVKEDEKESGIRAILNFGHTIGHAIETASAFSLTHGQAVSVGINAALSVSDVTDDEKADIRKLLSFFELPLVYDIQETDLEVCLKKDKKFSKNRYSYIKLDDLGKASIRSYKDLSGFSSMINIATKGVYNMYPEERFYSILKGEETDRCMLINPVSNATKESCDKLGLRFDEVHTDPDKAAALAAYGYEKLGFDSVMPYFSVVLEAAALGARINWGGADTMPSVRSFCVDDPDSFDIPDDFLDRPPVKALLETIKLLRQKLGKDALIIGKVMGPWTLSYNLHGLEDFLITLIEDPDKAIAFIDKFKHISMRFAMAQFDAGADTVTIADHATADLVSPETYRDMLLPAHREINGYFGEKKLILHCCGYTLDRIKYFREAGFSLFHFDSKNDVTKAFLEAGDMKLTGCLNNPELLLKGTERDVSEKTSELRQLGIRLISPECALPLMVPNKNLAVIKENIIEG